MKSRWKAFQTPSDDVANDDPLSVGTASATESTNMVATSDVAAAAAALLLVVTDADGRILLSFLTKLPPVPFPHCQIPFDPPNITPSLPHHTPSLPSSTKSKKLNPVHCATMRPKSTAYLTTSPKFLLAILLARYLA